MDAVDGLSPRREIYDVSKVSLFLLSLPFPKLSIYYPQKYLLNMCMHSKSHNLVVWLNHETFLFLTE